MREATLKEHLDNILDDMREDAGFFGVGSQDWRSVDELEKWRARWLEATISRPGFCVGCHSCETPCKGARD